MTIRFVETIVYDIEADTIEEAIEQFRETQPYGYTETLYAFDEDGKIVYQENDQNI